MINVKYDRASNTTRVELNRLNIFTKEQLPLTIEFKRYVDGKIDWTSKLDADSWVEWKGGETPYNFTLTTVQDERVYDWKYNVETCGTTIEKTLYYFIKSAKTRPRGLIIGSHNGLFGHWIFPVLEDLTDVILVDGSLPQLEEAKTNYSHISNIVFRNEIITPDGRAVQWFEGGEGFTNTVCKPVISKFLKDDEITSVIAPSTSINDLFDRYGEHFDWLHLDCEGLDSDLILALKYRPTLIIFESEHLSNNKYARILDWFQENNYSSFSDGFDCIAIKKK